MPTRNRFLQLFLAAACALTLAAAPRPAHAQEVPGPLLQQVEGALKAQNGAVHDLGKLLKPGGIKELEALADRYQKEGIHVYFITVPRGSANVDAVAERAYRDLNGQPTDMLIVFDGKRVYGKTLALKGHKEAFAQALEEAKPGSRQYYARGMALFAEALRKRMPGKKADASDTDAPPDAPNPASAPPVDDTPHPLLVAVPVGILVLGSVGGGIMVLRGRNKAHDTYQEHLSQAAAIYNRVTLALPDPAPADLSREWARLDEKLAAAKKGKASLAQVVDLVSDLKAFEARLG